MKESQLTPYVKEVCGEVLLMQARDLHRYGPLMYASCPPIPGHKHNCSLPELVETDTQIQREQFDRLADRYGVRAKLPWNK